jgi:hypothetical protein
MKNKQLLGVLGCVVLFIGVFAPAMSFPIVGGMSYMKIRNVEAWIVLVAAGVSLALVLTSKYKGLWVTGVGSLLAIGYSVATFVAKMREMKAEMSGGGDDPFQRLGQALAGSVQIQWGIPVLVVGAVLLIVAAATKESVSPQVAVVASPEPAIPDMVACPFCSKGISCDTLEEGETSCLHCGNRFSVSME